MGSVNKKRTNDMFAPSIGKQIVDQWNDPLIRMKMFNQGIGTLQEFTDKIVKDHNKNRSS